MPAEKKNLKDQTRFVDRPDVPTIYADFLETATFNGSVLWAEFTVARWNEPQPPKPPTGVRYPAARLALHPNAVADLYNRLSQLVAMMESTGMMTREGGKPTVVN